MIENMKNRIALADNPVGVSKSSNKNLPPISHTYGYSAKPDKYGAGDCKINIIIINTILFTFFSNKKLVNSCSKSSSTTTKRFYQN